MTIGKTCYVYPCVFSYSFSKKNFTFYFPDFPEAYGTINGMHETYVANNRLTEVISQYKAEGKPLPAPSDPENITINEQVEQVRFIEVWV